MVNSLSTEISSYVEKDGQNKSDEQILVSFTVEIYDMVHINYFNQIHLWIPGYQKLKFTFAQVIEELYKLESFDFSPDKKSEEFLFYQNGSLLVDHDLKVYVKGPYQNSDEIFVLKKVELKMEDEFFQRSYHLVREMFHVIDNFKNADVNSLMREFESLKKK
jgi:hypothetical protein